MSSTGKGVQTYAEMRAELNLLAERNERLSASLRTARNQIVQLKSDLERVAEPPNSYATFLTRTEGSTIDVMHHGRRLRIATSVTVDLDALTPGTVLRVNESMVAVQIAEPETAGTLVSVVEELSDDRIVVSVGPDDVQVLRRGGRMQQVAVHPGDSVLVDLKAHLVLERVERSHITDLVLAETPDVTFEQIGGLASQIDEIRDAIELPFVHPDLYRTYGLRPPKGVLLYGPPGCGKTMIAKAVARELSLRRTADTTAPHDAALDTPSAFFLNIKGPELLNKYVGETERSIRVIFERARELASQGDPVVVFFDEMESLFRTRGTGLSSDVETTIVPQLLAEIDGVETLDNVIVIGASNREDMIDPAIMRPGRLDVKVKIRRPDAASGREILALHLDEAVPVAGDRGELLDAAIAAIYADDPSAAYVRLQYSDGGSETLYFKDFISGAILRNIADRAKKLAVKEQLRTGTAGITIEHVHTAVALEREANESLPSGTHPEEWARLLDRRSRKISAVIPVGRENTERA